MLSENKLSPTSLSALALKRTANRRRVLTRKLLLCLHLISVSAQLGAIVALLGIYLICLFTNEIVRQAVLYDASVALEYFVLYPAIALSITTGVIIGIYNNSGFLTAWWLIVKQGVFGLAGVVIAVFIGPASPNLADLANARPAARAEIESSQFSILSALAFYLAVSIFLVVISVFKPWGKRKAAARARNDES